VQNIPLILFGTVALHEMTTVKENHSLLPYNTFGIDVKSRYFAAFSDRNELAEFLTTSKYLTHEKLILGGGSNILFTKDFDGTVIKNNLTGIELVKEDENHFYVKAGAGENWHQFVLHCIEKGYAGIENMSLIPGNVGASPMQNIGAYGVEIKDVFVELEAMRIDTGEVETFSHVECNFGYRESVFKRELKGQHIIISVTYRLNKTPNLNTSYGAIEAELERLNVTEPDIRSVSAAVINIRSSKLPDPNKIGNAGSFFKNPVIDNLLYEKVKAEFPNVAAYPATATSTKLAAGWLIEQAGWKGKTFDNYGVHKNQALVLVNYGGASGNSIYDLSTEIKGSVKEKFGVDLEREVNIL
jgi:UDP-N-acetylmuramate dehydrogenase